MFSKYCLTVLKYEKKKTRKKNVNFVYGGFSFKAKTHICNVITKHF